MLSIQYEAAKCGLACVATVANLYGHDLDLTSSLNHFSVSLKSSTLQQPVLLTNKLGLAWRALKLELADLNKLQTPCILHWEMNNFVVLTKIHRCAN